MHKASKMDINSRYTSDSYRRYVAILQFKKKLKTTLIYFVIQVIRMEADFKKFQIEKDFNIFVK